MSFTALAVIVLALMLCLGPVMLMAPNKSQRQLTKLRSRALELGMRVRSASVKRDKSDERALVTVYERPWEAKIADNVALQSRWCLVRRAFEHELHFHAVWDWDSEQKAPNILHSELKSFVQQLPDSVVAVEQNGAGLGVYWKEQGGISQLCELADLLHKVSANISASLQYEKQR